MKLPVTVILMGAAFGSASPFTNSEPAPSVRDIMGKSFFASKLKSLKTDTTAD